MASNELSIPIILKIIKKHFFKMCGIVFIILVITTGLFFVVPYKFTADAVILPPAQESMGGGLGSFLTSLSGSSGGGGMSLLGAATGGGGTKSRVYSSMLRSRAVCQYVIDDVGLLESEYFEDIEPQKLLEILQKKIFTDVRKNGMIDVELALSTPFFATRADKDTMANLTADIINSSLMGLDSIIKSQAQNRSNLSKDYIEKELLAYGLQLDSIETLLEEYQSQNKVLEIKEQIKMILEQAVAMGTELGTAKVKLAVAKQQFQPNAPQLNALREEYNTLATQYESIQTGGLTGGDAIGIPLANVPKLTREYAALYRDKKIIEEVMLYLETLRHQEAISVSKKLPSITILDNAQVPYKKTAPKYSMMYIFAFIFGWLIALVWAFYRSVKEGMITVSKSE